MKFIVIKILIFVGLILFVAGNLSEYSILKLSPKYKKLNENIIKEKLEHLNINDNEELFLACKLMCASNKFYDDYRSLAIGIELIGVYCLAIAFFAICYYKFKIIGKILKLE